MDGEQPVSDSTERNDEEPLAELRDFALDPDPELPARIRRDINRRTLAASSLEFSLNVMLSTFWEHLRSAIDSWPGLQSPTEEDDDNE